MVVQGVPALLWSDQVTRQISRNEQNRPPQVLQSTLRIGGEGTPGHYSLLFWPPPPAINKIIGIFFMVWEQIK